MSRRRRRRPATFAGANKSQWGERDARAKGRPPPPILPLVDWKRGAPLGEQSFLCSSIGRLIGGNAGDPSTFSR